MAVVGKGVLSGGGRGWLSTRREQKVSVLKSRHVRMFHREGWGGEKEKECMASCL